MMKSTFTVRNTIYKNIEKKTRAPIKTSCYYYENYFFLFNFRDTLIHIIKVIYSSFYKIMHFYRLFASTMGFRTVSKLAIVLTPLFHSRNFVVWSQSNTIIHDYLILFLFNDFFRSDLLNFFRGLFSWYLSFCGWFNWMFLLISFSVKSQTLELILLFFTNLEITP